MGYILVNPKLSDSNINSKKKSGVEAAEEIWSQLSENIKNYTPKFYFTIQDSESSKLSHFVVRESIENERVKYNLKQYKSKKIDEKSFLSELSQEGGKRKHKKYDDSSSSSSSSSDEELVYTFPSGPTYKNPLALTYYPTMYGVPNVLFPTFSTNFAPFTSIRLVPNSLIIYP